MLARLRALDPYRADLLLAGAFLVEALVELVVLVPDSAPDKWVMALIIAGLAGTLAIRRRFTIAAAIAVMPLFTAGNALDLAYVDHMVSPFFVMLLVLYGVGRHLEGRIVYALGAYGARVDGDLDRHRQLRRPRPATTSWRWSP